MYIIQYDKDLLLCGHTVKIHKMMLDMFNDD